MTSLWERSSSAYVPIVVRSSRADSVSGEVIASDATMVLRFIPVAPAARTRSKEIVHHGIRLRNLRQEAVVRHERLTLAPSHQATLEPEHPARTRTGGRYPHAHECLHRLHPIGQGHQACSS